MDKTKPTIPDLKLNKDTNNYYVVSNGSTDNVTSQDKLKYYFSENDLSYIGSIDYKLDTEKQDNYDINHQIAINSVVQQMEETIKNPINKRR